MVDFIAEVSSNHNQDLSRMKEFIYVAKETGCSGVKFQLFKIDQLFAPEILAKKVDIRNRKAWELPEKFIPELADYAHNLGIEFSCTPFYLEAVDILEQYVDFFKIASYELLWLDLIKKCGQKGKPVIISTGMAQIYEVKSAVEVLIDSGCPKITVLHCNSAYPTKPQDANLKAIATLREQLKVFSDRIAISVGWSDHTVSAGVIHRSVHKYDASLVEFHLDLDGKGDEYSAGHCWLPEQIKSVITDINTGFTADGTAGFGPSQSEQVEREWRADPFDGLRPLLKTRKSFE
jgi:sialic acid synthase SpsE